MIGRFFGVGSGAGRECSMVMVVVIGVREGGHVDIDREWVCRITARCRGFSLFVVVGYLLQGYQVVAGTRSRSLRLFSHTYQLFILSF